MQKDYYKILGVSNNATEDEVKRAYRKLAQVHHPDRPSGDEKKFKEINEAYQILSNKEKRAQYDRFGQTFDGPGMGSGGFNAGDFGGFNVNFDDLGDLGDIFETFFSGGKKRRTYTRGSDLQITQEITLEEAYSGVSKELKFKTYQSCETCSGMGHNKEAGSKTCEVCDGKGEVKEVRKSFFGSFQQIRVCQKCAGTGEIPNKICASCQGAGRTPANKVTKVQISPGISDGQLIKVAGAGETGERGAPTGDLYVQIKIKPNKNFERKEDNLFIKKELKLSDILFDKRIKIPTISGKEIEVEIPTGFNLAEKLKIAGEGLPHLHRRGHGDLFVEFIIRAPKKLSSKARKFLEEQGEIF